jgi:phosphoglycolate phosphatase
MKNQYDLLIFDWDGTLFDSIPWIVSCLQWAARDCGLPIPPDAAARSVIGLSLNLAMAELFPGESSNDIDALVQAYVHYYHTRPAGPEGLFEGIPEMLDALKQAGYRLAIATGKQNCNLPQVLGASGASHWFDAFRGADASLSKPDPRMLHEIMADLRVPPERTLMIGDSIHDLRMAANADVKSVGVSCGANTAEELLSLNPIYCLAQTKELLPLLV